MRSAKARCQAGNKAFLPIYPKCLWKLWHRSTWLVAKNMLYLKPVIFMPLFQNRVAVRTQAQRFTPKLSDAADRLKHGIRRM